MIQCLCCDKIYIFIINLLIIGKVHTMYIANVHLPELPNVASKAEVEFWYYLSTANWDFSWLEILVHMSLAWWYEENTVSLKSFPNSNSAFLQSFCPFYCAELWAWRGRDVIQASHLEQRFSKCFILCTLTICEMSVSSRIAIEKK